MRKVTLILAAALVIFGCKKSETTSSTTTTETTASTATTAPPPAQPAAAAPAPAAAAPTSGSIANADGEQTGMRVDITELKRASGGTVNLKYVVSNNGDKSYDVYGHFGDRYDTDGVNLVDPVNKKKYFVIKDTENKCLCSRDVQGTIKEGQKVNLWAKFPAPPPDVTKVSIAIPHFQPIDDVPISQ